MLNRKYYYLLEFLYVVFKFIEKHCLEVFLVGPVYEIFFWEGGEGVKGKRNLLFH